MTERTTNNHKANEVTPLLTNRQRNNAKRKSVAVKTKPSPWFIIAPLFFLAFAIGALFAPMIQFYTIVFCKRYYQSDSGGDSNIPLGSCAIPEVQAIVSKAQAIIVFLTYGSTLLMASFYGALSDRRGRRIVLQISAIGNIIIMVCYILTIKYESMLGVSLLFIAPAVSGFLAGGDTILTATIRAYISDCTTAADRTIVFGRFMGSILLGTTLGPTVASILIKQTGSIVSIFYMVFCIHLLFGIYVTFVLPESHDFSQFVELDKSNKKEQTLLQRLNVFSALQTLYRTVPRHANRYALPLIAVTQFLIIVAAPPILLYAMLKFGWTAVEGGLYISLASFSKLVVLIFVLPLLSKLFHKTGTYSSTTFEENIILANTKTIAGDFTEHGNMAAVAGPSATPLDKHQEEVQSVVVGDPRSEAEIKRSIVFDIWMIRAGLATEITGLIIFGLVKTSSGFAMNAILLSLSALISPSLSSLATTLVSPNKVGGLLGAMAVVEACAAIISQLIVNTIYSASVSTMPQLIFFICAGIAGLSFFLVLFIKPSLKTCHQEEEGRY